MAIEVFWGSGSTPAWRVLLGFAIKGVPYESKQLSFSAGDTRSEWFKAINPRHKVPTVRDGGIVVTESLAILKWLDDRAPEPPLFGVEPEQSAQIWRRVLEFQSHGDPAFSGVARPLFAAAPDAEEVRERLPAALHELDVLESWVESGFVVGEQLSAADIAWFCGVQMLVRGVTRPTPAAPEVEVWPIADRWPAIGRWAAKIEAIPGYEATFPPHWLEGPHPSPRHIGAP